MSKIIPPRRSESIIENGKATPRFIEYLEQNANQTNDTSINISEQVLAVLPANSNSNARNATTRKKVATNTVNIAINADNIADNANKIAQTSHNTARIAANRKQITKNKNDISENENKIAQNSHLPAKVAINRKRNTKNEADIATNTDDIADNSNKISQNSHNPAKIASNRKKIDAHIGLDSTHGASGDIIGNTDLASLTLTGVVKQADTVADTTDVTDVAVQFNLLLAKLRTAGVLKV